MYAGWWEALNDATFLDKLCFGLLVWKMKQVCLIVRSSFVAASIPCSEEMAGTGREKRTEEASGGIM